MYICYIHVYLLTLFVQNYALMSYVICDDLITHVVGTYLYLWSKVCISYGAFGLYMYVIVPSCNTGVTAIDDL